MTTPRIAIICMSAIDRFTSSDAIYQVPLRLARRARVTLFSPHRVETRELAGRLAEQVIFTRGSRGLAEIREAFNRTGPGEGWDLVISGVDASSAAAALSIKRSYGIAWIAICEDHPYGSRYDNPGPLRRVERAIRTPLLRRLLSRADRMIYFINPGVCDFLKLDPAKAVYLTNSADLELIEPIRRAAAEAVGEGSEPPPVIACIGVVNEAKGAIEMLQVLARVRQSIPAARLKLIGDVDKTFAPKLDRLIAELKLEGAVELTGLLPHAEALRHAARAALCIHAYRPLDWLYWNQVLKICEYLALGRAVVAWDYPGVRDLIPPSAGCGRLIPPGDVEAMACGIGDILSTPGARARMVAEALARAEEIGWSRAGDQLSTIVQKIIGERLIHPKCVESQFAIPNGVVRCNSGNVLSSN